GHKALERTLSGGLIDTSRVDRIDVVDAFYQDTTTAIVGSGIGASRVFQYDLVNNLGTGQGFRSRIPGDTRVLLSAEMDQVAAICYVRLLEDLKASRPGVARMIAANPAVANQLASITLPPRGRFSTHGPVAALSGTVNPMVDLKSFI